MEIEIEIQDRNKRLTQMSTIFPYSLKMRSRSCLLEVGFMFPQKMLAERRSSREGKRGNNRPVVSSYSRSVLRLDRTLGSLH